MNAGRTIAILGIWGSVAYSTTSTDEKAVIALGVLALVATVAIVLKGE